MLSIASAGRRAASATIRLRPLAAAQSGWASSTRYVSTPSRQPAHAFSSTSVASNELPLKTLRDLLVLSKDVQGVDAQAMPVNEKKPTTAADFLTLMSQIILVGSTGFLLYCAVFPNQMSNMLENYKEQLTQRRHDRILEFMTSERPYLSGSVERATKNESEDSATSSLMFHNEIYHTEVAGDIKKVLLQAPVLRYGILTGPTGSGKSRLIRTLVKEESHYAVLSMGLISGVKSLVDALSEEIGYDFDDWTERMLQGYLFNGSTVSFPTQLDKLAFLLDEFEEACWSLKFNAKHDPAAAGNSTGTTTTKSNVKRPVLVLDDIDLLDTSDKDTRQAVRMLFNSANKWAREDTALVVFTTGNASLMDETGEIAKIVRPEVLELAKVYNVGCLTPESADRFLMDRIGVYRGVKGAGFEAGDLERKKVQWVVGTKMFDLIKVCDELVKKDLSVDQVLHAQLSEAVADVRRAFDDVGNVVGERQMRSLCRWMDSIAQIPVSEAASKGHLFEEARRKGFGDAMKFLLGRDVVSSNGLFSSDLIRNAYCKYRNIPITYTPSIETKKSRGCFFLGGTVLNNKSNTMDNKRHNTKERHQRHPRSHASHTSEKQAMRGAAGGGENDSGPLGWSWIGVSAASAQGVEWERIGGKNEVEGDMKSVRELESGSSNTGAFEIHLGGSSLTTNCLDSPVHQMTPPPTIDVINLDDDPSKPIRELGSALSQPISIPSSMCASRSVSAAASVAESEIVLLSMSLLEENSNAALASPSLGHSNTAASDKEYLDAKTVLVLTPRFAASFSPRQPHAELFSDSSSPGSGSAESEDTNQQTEHDVRAAEGAGSESVKPKTSCVKVKIPEKHRPAPTVETHMSTCDSLPERGSESNNLVREPEKNDEDAGKKESGDWFWRLLILGGKLAVTSISIVLLSKFVRRMMQACMPVVEVRLGTRPPLPLFVLRV
ncbi:hypothetical protein HDU77_011277 [Chytriomyces hyalinus]|nr:hypothetical protein HDU77_011277 [Chytriomyces hyalinus]